MADGGAVAATGATGSICFIVMEIVSGYSLAAPVDPSTAADTTPTNIIPTIADVGTLVAKYSFASRQPSFVQCAVRTESLLSTTTDPGVVTDHFPRAFDNSQVAPEIGTVETYMGSVEPSTTEAHAHSGAAAKTSTPKYRKYIDDAPPLVDNYVEIQINNQWGLYGICCIAQW